MRYFGSLDAAPLECGADLARVRLTAEGADTEELGGDLLVWPERAEGWLVVKPPEPLLPETRYELALRASLGDACSCESVWTTVSSFETDAASDVRPPSLSGSREASYGDRETSTNNCGTMDGVPLVTVLGLADDFQGARYNIYVDGELTSPYRDRVTANAEGAEIYVDCGTTALSTATRVEPGANVEIRAVDLAGNESAPGDALSVPDKCAQSSGSGSGSDSDSGCSLSASHPGSWLDGFWSIALLAGLARRLRSPRQ